MKIDLSIYNRILFDDLRPWIEDNKSETKFQNKITAAFKNPKGGSIAFDKAISAALKDWKKTNIEEDYIFEIAEDNEKFKSIADEISEPLIEVETSEPTNPKQEFYFFLIRNEGTRLINNLHKAVQIAVTENEKKYYAVSVLQKINSFLSDIEKQKKLLQKNQDAAQKKNNDFIFSVLKSTLIRLHLEMKEVFPSLLSGKASDEKGIFENVLNEIPPARSIIKNKVGLNSFAVKRYINIEKYSKGKTLDLINQTLESIVKHFGTVASTKEEAERKSVLQENIKALENLYYVNENDFVEERPNYETLIDETFEEKIFATATAQINERIAEQNLGAKQLPVIVKEEQQLEFLQAKIKVDESVFTLSIPRKVLVYLSIQRANAQLNLKIDFSTINEGRTPPLKTNFSVGDVALLFRMLAELKPDVIDEKVKANIFRFISSNFTTKKSKEGAISTDKISKLFNNPDTKSVEFWKKHLYTMIDFLKKV